MNWLLRFSLGLPARRVDVEQMRRDVPELLNETWHPLDTNFDGLVFPVVVGRVLYPPRELAGELRAWVEDLPRTEENRAPDPQTVGSACDHPECPRKISGTTSATRHESATDPASQAPDEAVVIKLMAVGGGPGKKPMRERFFDLVRRVHAGAGAAKRIFVTDPFILTDANEDGVTGGFKNFCEYLRAVRPADDACLFIPPGPKKPTASRERWIERVKREIPCLSVSSYSAALSFHDRFYIVEHAGGSVRGVFGPSMNGLSANDIVLFGELEIPNALATLSQWFELQTPPTRPKKPKLRRPHR